MAEETLQPVNYVSNNPEQNWARFQDTLRYILSTSKQETVVHHSEEAYSEKDATETRDRHAGCQ